MGAGTGMALGAGGGLLGGLALGELMGGHGGGGAHLGLSGTVTGKNKQGHESGVAQMSAQVEQARNLLCGLALGEEVGDHGCGC